MFTLSEKELKKANDWINSKPIRYEGACGGRFSYIFTPNSIGITIIIRDNLMKDELNITDYDEW